MLARFIVAAALVGAGALAASLVPPASAGSVYRDATSSEIPQADLTAGSCTLGMLRIDTGGATKELCYCAIADTWYCWSATTVTGPSD